MRALIISGGSIDVSFAKAYIRDEKWDFVIAADAGMDFCRRAGLLPDVLLGDFDSAAPETLDYFYGRCPDRMIQYPAKKDETDTELALKRAIREGAKEIAILGATGSRIDHVLGNIHLLRTALDADVSCVIVDAHNRIRLICDRLVLARERQFGKYVSLIPFTPRVCGLTLFGFVYEVRDFTLESGCARGVSNEIADKEALITLKEGILLVIESRD